MKYLWYLGKYIQLKFITYSIILTCLFCPFPYVKCMARFAPGHKKSYICKKAKQPVRHTAPKITKITNIDPKNPNKNTDAIVIKVPKKKDLYQILY